MCRGKPPSPIITISDFFYFLKLFSKFGWSFISLWKHFFKSKMLFRKAITDEAKLFSWFDFSSSQFYGCRAAMKNYRVEKFGNSHGFHLLWYPFQPHRIEWTLPDQYNWKNSQHPNGVAPCSSYYQRLGFSYLVAPPP